MVSQKSFMKTLKQLVMAKSICGTTKENIALEKIVKLIYEIPYFQTNPENLQVIKVPEDRLNRAFVSAFIKSQTTTKETIIITGHFDVVGVDDFGSLKNIAFDIKKITARIKELNPDTISLSDLESGEWLFGRGIADMKYGIALCIEILRWFSKKDPIPGNILFLGVPGEEANSEGMLAAIPYLENLQSNGYHFKACFNTECTVPKWTKDYTRRIYTGTIGKINPMFFCKGKEAHVCASLSCLNPNLIISEITRQIEGDLDFCTSFEGQFSPPPVCTKQTDLKYIYNAQTPLYAVSYYNLLILDINEEVLLQKLKEIAKNAFNIALDKAQKNAKDYSSLTGKLELANEYPPIILTFEELYRQVLTDSPEFERYIDNQINLWQKKGLDHQSISIKMIKELCDAHKYQDPIIIIGFCPPFYPSRIMGKTTNNEINLHKLIDQAIDFANENFNESIEKCSFYDAICDLSYIGRFSTNEHDAISVNMPGLGKNYKLPIRSLSNLNIPGVVFGGLGKDFHKNTERLHIPYSLGVVPKVYEFILNEIFHSE